MKAAKESVLVLRECRKCGYAACICGTLRHKPTCPWRRAVLDMSPKPCAPHDRIACAACGAVCDCGGPMVVVKPAVAA